MSKKSHVYFKIQSIDQSALLNDYFGVTQTGSVYVRQGITALGSGIVNFKVIATDGGGNQTEADVTVVISPSTTTSTTTTTDRFVSGLSPQDKIYPDII